MGLYLGIFGSAGLLLGLLVCAAVLLRWRGALRRLLAEERASAERSVADAAAGRARAEQTLRETQAHFQELLKGRKGYALFTLDAAGRVQTWTREAEEVYGYAEEEVRGRPVSRFYPSGEAAAGAADLHLSNARANGRMDEGGWRVRRDGRTFRARVVLLARHDARGKVEGFWCLTEDLTGQSPASAILARGDAAFGVSSEGARDVMIGLAADGKITYLNRAFERATGLGRREWLDKPFSTLVHSGDWPQVTDLLRRLGGGESPPSVEVRLLASSSRHVAVELTATPFGTDGAPQGSFILARPTAGRKAAEPPRPPDDGMVRSQKLEALGRLAGGVAHDFNNLLTVILGYADLMARHGADDHAREVGDEIRKAAERAAALTRQLLAFSRRQVLQPSVLDLNGLVRNLDSMLRRLIGEDIQLATALHPTPLNVRADAGQLEQVLTNLVVNARDAMPRGGRLIVSTAEVPASIESTRLTGATGFAMLTVTDSGCGMNEDVLKRLFEPFFTTKEVGKGTGLGLAMVYGIVQQSGGRVEVESEPGRGSTFRVYLPLTHESAEAPAPPSGGAKPSGGTETVLLVEDEEAVRLLARLTLQAQGYQVLEAGDGVAALTVCQRHLPSIDLIVTDVVMPELSGVDLVERLRAVRPHLKVLYMSGYNDSMVVRHGMEESEANFLQKPFTPDLLKRKVRDLLDQTPQRN